MLQLTLHAVVSNALLALAAWGAGCWIARFLPEDSPSVERLGLPLLGGLGILGTVLFVIGQFSFSRATILLILVVAAAIGVLHIVLAARQRKLPFRWPSPPRIAAIVIVLVLCLTAISGLAEITGDWGVDSITYHLLGPKVWLRDGIIRPVPDESLTAFPQTAEMLFAAALSTGGERAPGFSAALFFAAFFLVSATLALRAGLGNQGAWWVAALVAAMPAVYAGMHSCFIDGFFASFVLAAATAGFTAKRMKQFLLFGLFSGLAMGTKYTGIPAFGALFVCAMFFHAVWRKDRRAVARQLSFAGLTACLVASPFYLRNWILLGSPIYPPPLPMMRIFHPKYLSLAMMHNFQDYILKHGAGLGSGPLAYLLLPFNLTYHTSNFNGAGGIGLAPLGLGLFGVLAARRNRLVKYLMLLAWMLLTLWFLTLQESRYLIHVYVIAAVFAVIGWRWVLATANRGAKLLSALIIAISLLYGLFMMNRAWQNGVHAVLSPSYAERAREQSVPFWQSFEFLNRHAEVTKILILDPSVPPYYSDKEYIKPFGMWGERVLPGISRPVDVFPRLKSLGISHILDVHSSVAGFQVPPGTPGLTLVFQLPDQRIYRVDR